MQQSSSRVTAPVMRYHGAKFRLAPWVMSFFPEHDCYVEAFGGSAGILIQKPRVFAEVYNDLDSRVVNLFRVLRDPEKSAALELALKLTPFSREEFNSSWDICEDEIENARRLLARSHMGFGSVAATRKSCGFRSDVKRAYANAAHIWAKYPRHIQAFCERLQGVMVENRPAAEVITRYDSATTLHYVDPPYIMDTRNSHCDQYRYEMTDVEHEALLQTLKGVEGFVVLSGYDHDLYNDTLHGWQKHQTRARISTNRGTGTRIETLWLSPNCANRKPQGDLLDLPA